MSETETTPSGSLALYLADTTLAVGLQYGLWVERSPSTEEQVALSSMSQDKLGHARALLQIAEKITGRSSVELLYDREPEAFRWNPAVVAPLPSWDHLVLSQVLFGPSLMAELDSLDGGSRLAGPRSKIKQEETWHTRHGDAWLERGAQPGLESAFEDLWPFLVAFHGPADEERFPEDIDAGVLTRSDAKVRAAVLDEVVPQLEAAGIQVPAERTEAGWRTDPEPTAELVGELESTVEENVIELVGLLQDPEGRELAEIA